MNSKQRRKREREIRSRWNWPPIGVGFVLTSSAWSVKPRGETFMAKTPKAPPPGTRLPTAVEAKWADAAARPGESIDMGDIVVCDSCNVDYRGKDASGGMIFESKAICPRCTPRWMESITKYNEQHAIRAKCPEGMSFWQFVLVYRREHGGNAIKIMLGDEALDAIMGKRK